MIERLRNIVSSLRGSLWVIPLLMSIASVALAYTILFGKLPLEEIFDTKSWWLFSGDASTARGLLAAMMSGMITMTSLVVSITMVVLSLAAGQLGPRIIWNFIRDRQIQTVLGLFLATIFYLLIVLRSVNDELGADYVPHFAVTLGSLMTAICLFALLFHIHKVSRSIIADEVVNRVAGELEGSVAALDPARADPPHAAWEDRVREYPHSRPVSFDRAGHVQIIDYGSLLELARRQDLMIRIEVRAGHFVHRAGRHATIHAKQAVTDGEVGAVRDAAVISHTRSPTQDIEYAIRQLVEIAIRALSPGINDPFTAIAVIHRLGSALEQLADRELRPTRDVDEDGVLRLSVDASDFPGLLDAAMNQIRQAAKSNTAVLIELVSVCARLALVWNRPEQREALEAHVRKLRRSAHQHIDDDDDLGDFDVAAREAGRLIPGTHPESWPSRRAQSLGDEDGEPQQQIRVSR